MKNIRIHHVSGASRVSGGRRQRTRGFTLIELLVVLSITSLLIALLLPALSAAQQAARDSTCLAKERQLGVAFSNYLTEWKETYPYIRPSAAETWPVSFSVGNVEQPWTVQIRRYLGFNVTATVIPPYRCPSNPWPATGTQNPTTYGMNDNGFPANWTNDQSGISPFVDPAQRRASRREGRIAKPSSLLLLGEIVNGNPGPNGASWSGGFAVNNTLFRTDSAGLYWRSTSPSTWTYYPSKSVGVISAASNTVRLTHGAILNDQTGWNSLMADGSAKFFIGDRLAALTGNGSPAAGTAGAAFWANR
jgi:prepilin-type N-terminal cleavage/methylation domain-containing protein